MRSGGTIDLEGECQHARAVAVFTAPHEDRAAAHLTVYRGIIEQLEQVEIDAFPTAFVTVRPPNLP
jgi:acid stress-induced BolA-like protein IbaG/YrbA